MFLVLFLFLLHILNPVVTITVEFDGLIDLGPNWNYEYHKATRQDDGFVSKYFPPFLRTDKPKTAINKIEIVSNNEKLKQVSKLNEINIDKSLLNNITNDIKNNTFDIQTEMDINRTSNSQNGKEDKTSSQTLRQQRKNKKNKHEEGILDHENINLDIDVSKSAKKNKKRLKSVTKFIDKQSKEVKSRKVKEDGKIHEFIVHIYKQTLKVFDDIKKKTNDSKLKRKINSLKSNFEEKFGYYLTQSYNHTLKTKLGTHKIILNTIDTSNKLLQRIINNQLYDSLDKDFLRTNIDTINVFQKEIDREKDLEHIHACKQLGICRLNDEFSDFLTDILVIVLQTDDSKVQQAADALTEVLKNADFDNVLNYDMQVKLKQYISQMEYWDALMSRAMFLVLKNLIKNKNKPIVIMNNQDNYLANKTLAFQDIINIWNEKLPKSENQKEWEEIKQDVVDWKDGKNKNALGIVESLVRHFKEKALDKMDYEEKKRFNKSMELLLSHY